MGVLATDTFDGSGSDLGANWDVDTGLSALERVSGEAGAPNTLVDCDEHYTAATFPDDQYSKAVTSGAVSSTNQTGQIVSCRINGNNGYYCEFHDAGRNLFRRVGGTFTQISTAGSAISVGDTIEIRAQGTTISTLVNGANTEQVTDSNVVSGDAGIGIYTPNLAVRITSWEGGDFLEPDVEGPGQRTENAVSGSLTTHISDIAVIGAAIVITKVDARKSHNFVGVQFFADAAGTTPASPTVGTITIEIETVNTTPVRETLATTISAGAPTTVPWSGNTKSVRIVPSGVDVATHYRAVVTCNVN